MQLAYETVEEYFREEDVHDVQRVSRGDEIISLLISLLWTFLHSINVYWVLWEGMSLVFGGIIHVILTLVIIIVTWAMKGLGRDIRYLYILCIASFAASIFGALGTALASLLSLYYNLVAQPFAEWYQTIFPKIDLSDEEEAYELITTGKDDSARDYSVMSFMDIITLGTEAQKRRTLSRMTDQFNPIFAPAYKQALQDDSNAIRVQAASSVAKIENQFIDMLMKVEKLEEARDDDPIVKLGLARFYDSYAFTGLLDDEREEENRIKALDKYREYLEMQPDDIEARIEAGRLLLRSGEYDQVLQLFNDCIEAGYDDNALRLWMIEALYEAGRYDELRRVAPQCTNALHELDNVRPRLARAIRYWTGDAS